MEESIEQEIQRKCAAPRVTPADVEAAVASEHYFTAAEGAAGANIVMDGGRFVVGVHPSPRALGLLTFCVLVLRNGFTVVGTSACASPENFDAEIGKRVARQDAVRQVWPLLGYALKERMREDAIARMAGIVSR